MAYLFGDAVERRVGLLAVAILVLFHATTVSAQVQMAICGKSAGVKPIPLGEDPQPPAILNPGPAAAVVDDVTKVVKSQKCSPLFATDAHVNVRIGQGYSLVIWMKDASAPMSANVAQVVFSAAGRDPITHGFKAGESTHRYLVIPLDRIYRQFVHGDLVAVQLKTNKADSPIVREGYFGVYHLWSAYGVGSAPTGIWIPAGLFATNFQSKENGIPFAAMPFGIAAGGKRHWASWDGLRQGYLGGSLFVAYTIAITENAKVEPENMPGEDTEKSDDGFTLSAMSIGPLFDISGWTYMGAAYTFDFRKDYDNPGFQFVVGLGSSFLKLLGNSE